MFQSSSLFDNITNIIVKLASDICICFVSSSLYEILETESDGH